MYNSKLKIEQVHYEMIRRYINLAIVNYKSTFSELKKDYADDGLTEKRFRWDLMYVANKIFQHDHGKSMFDALYEYINDTHIDSALKCVIKEFENES